MAPNLRNRLAHAFLVWFGFTAVLALIPAYLGFDHWQTAHWLNTDGKSMMATVIAFDRPALRYRYTIDEISYYGDVKTRRPLETGDKLEVFVSSSHPEISSLAKPPLSFDGGSYLAVVIGMSVLVLVGVIAGFRDEKSS